LSYLALVNAEQTYQQAAVSLVQARGIATPILLRCFHALGGAIEPVATAANNSLGVSLNRQRS